MQKGALSGQRRQVTVFNRSKSSVCELLRDPPEIIS